VKPAWRQRWDVTPGEARAIQNEVRRRVILTDDPAVSFETSNFNSQISNPETGEGVSAPSVPPHSAFNIPHSPAPLPQRLVAADVGYDKVSNLCFASVVEWDTAESKEVAHWTHVQPAKFPYVPGLLSFREIPALLPIFDRSPSRRHWWSATARESPIRAAWDWRRTWAWCWGARRWGGPRRG
jgi:hypothetical protein